VLFSRVFCTSTSHQLEILSKSFRDGDAGWGSKKDSISRGDAGAVGMIVAQLEENLQALCVPAALREK